MTWRSTKQNVVSLFSVEVEYHILHQAIIELIWLKILLRELAFSPQKPMAFFRDNTMVIGIANNSIRHDETKHIELDRNYIKDNLTMAGSRFLVLRG